MGALYHLKQKLVDFCNVIQENVSRTDTVPSSKVVYDLKADSDSKISDLNDSLAYNQVQTGISGVDAYKMGHIVTLVFNLTNLSVSANAWNNVGTLPSALRPKQYLQSNGYDGRNNKAIEFNIQSTGLVRAYFFDANVYFRATITYISND